MEPIAEPGAPITVIRRAHPTVQYPGKVSASRRAAVAVMFADPPAWDGDDDVMLIVGPPAARFAATGRFVAAQAALVAFAVTGPWQPLELSKAPRRALDVVAEVRSVLGQSRQPGRILDVSAEGMTVVVATKPGGKAVDVVLTRDGFSSHFRCDTVSSTSESAGVTLQLTYQDLTTAQQAFVRQLVASTAKPREGAA
ncbi:MAG: hypothetical protein C0506_03060 [Anaerolinea sp.]|nr:hypothetical protein [Anaerolinea sp.]